MRVLLRLLVACSAFCLPHFASAQTTASWTAATAPPVVAGVIPTLDWHTAANWTPSTVPNAVGDTAILPSTQTANRQIALSVNATLTSLQIANATAFTNQINYTPTTAIDTADLIFDADGIVGNAQTATITVTGNSTNTGNVNVIRGAVVLNDDIIIDTEIVNSSQGAVALTFIGGNGGGMSGVGGITKRGAGSLVFGDTLKEFQGPLIIEEGRMRFNSGARVPNVTSAVEVQDGGQITFDASGASGNLTFGGERPMAGLGPIPDIKLNGLGIGIFPGALRVGGGFTQTLNNAIELQTDTAINVDGGGLANGTLTLTSAISGAGKLIVGALPGAPDRRGELIFTVGNSYAGGTEIHQGTLVINAAGSLSGGNVLVDGVSAHPTAPGGSSEFAGRLRLGTGVTNAISDTATLTLTGSGYPVLDALGRSGGTINISDVATNEIVGGLVLGGMAQAAGTYTAATHPLFITGPGSITVVPAAVDNADFDGDGDVDGADFLTWQRGLGLSGPAATMAAGNANSDTVINGADLAVWRAQFGLPAVPAVGTIPEPGTVLLALLAAPLGLLARRNRVA